MNDKVISVKDENVYYVCRSFKEQNNWYFTRDIRILREMKSVIYNVDSPMPNWNRILPRDIVM